MHYIDPTRYCFVVVYVALDLMFYMTPLGKVHRAHGNFRKEWIEAGWDII